MKTTRWLVHGITVAFVMAGGWAWAQDRLDAEALKLYGGTYSADCSNSAAARLHVIANALVVEQGTKRLTGSNVQAAYAYFGQSPPPDYQVALLSEVRGGSQLLFIVFRDRTGRYLTLDGDARVQASLGRTLLSRKFHSCDPAGKEVAAAAPGKAPAETIGPPELLLDARFKTAYYKALGARVKESWLAKLDGPAPPVKKITVANTEYLLVSACKNHDCADNNTVLLYSAAQGTVYGKVVQQRRATLIGEPSGTVAVELDRLWRAEWRQK